MKLVILRGQIPPHPPPPFSCLSQFALALRYPPFFSRGAFNLSDVRNAGSNEDLAKIHNLQASIQIDDVINIQFTSVCIISRLEN